MTSPTMLRASSAALLAGVLCLAACATTSPPPQPEMSQLEVRQLQSKEYQTTDEKAVMKAMIASLQDEGFIINTANPELGLVTATLEVGREDPNTKFWARFWNGPAATYETVKRLESSVTVQKLDPVTRVRINIVAKMMTNSGGVVWSQPVYDPDVYQKIFSKVDKSIFLGKEKL